MAQLLEIKTRIRSVDSTLKITRAMKMIATARLAKARERYNRVRPVYKRLETMASRLLLLSGGYRYPMWQGKGGEKILLVVLGTDKGFCGGYNLRLFSFVEEMLDKYGRDNTYILPVGQKAQDYYESYPQKTERTRDLQLIWEKDLFNQSRNLFRDVAGPFQTGEYGKVYLVYNKFQSILTQQPVAMQLLPLKPPKAQMDDSEGQIEYIFEPGRKEILETLTETYLILSVQQALIELETGEYGARMTAMDGANRNGEKLTKKLKIQFQRARQEAITRQITEIIGGAETLRRERDE